MFVRSLGLAAIGTRNKYVCMTEGKSHWRDLKRHRAGNELLRCLSDGEEEENVSLSLKPTRSDICGLDPTHLVKSSFEFVPRKSPSPPPRSVRRTSSLPVDWSFTLRARERKSTAAGMTNECVGTELICLDWWSRWCQVIIWVYQPSVLFEFFVHCVPSIVFHRCEYLWCFSWTLSRCLAMCCCFVFLSSSSLESSVFNCGKVFCVIVVSRNWTPPLLLNMPCPSKWKPNKERTATGMILRSREFLLRAFYIPPDQDSFVCSHPQSSGMTKCSEIPKSREGNRTCELDIHAFIENLNHHPKKTVEWMRQLESILSVLQRFRQESLFRFDQFR